MTVTVADYTDEDRTGGKSRQMRLRPTFQSPYGQHVDRIDLPFEFVRECTEADGFDAETLPAYVVRFADGTEIHAWPEEIDAEEIWQP